MHIHHPGRPGDLPAPEELWSRWALAAVLTASARGESAGLGRTGWWAEGDALRRDDGGTSWWVLLRAGAGRFLLYGWDEAGDVEAAEPEIDVFAGAPAWLSRATAREVTGPLEVGCAYWYEDGAWARAPYPPGLDDDGLDFGLGATLTPENIRAWPAWEDAELLHAYQELTASALARTLTAELLEAVAARAATGASTPDVPAMLRALEATGLNGGRAPREPAPVRA